ncbi:MAG: GNAT family N-acetyltransferase [Patescibacteria group bacterium]
MTDNLYETITVTADNLGDYPQTICFINPKNEYFNLKIAWLKKQFKKGLVIKLLRLKQTKKIIGFVEYLPGEEAWRAVKATNYLFIHCLWVSPNKNRRHGLGTTLVAAALQDAKKLKKSGVATITSDGPFMAKKELFVKNGFEIVEEFNNFQLLAKKFAAKNNPPKLLINQDRLKQYSGWHIIYSKQCPWVVRFVEEVKPILQQKKIKLNITEIDSAKKAQSAPGIYSVFNLIKDGQLLADRYISITRFLNIIKKEDL